MNPTPARLPLFFAALLCLFLGGCYYADNGIYVQRNPAPAYASPSTALVIVMPDNSTEADYVNWRGQIVDYLIQRGYITSESDLVGNPDNAQRIVRAIVGNGGFTLSVFNKDGAVAEAAPLYLEDSDVCYPEDPYFILGFAYFGEIGPRHLPPRPPGYRPHPHPPGYRPPVNRPNYDWNRHWSGPQGNPPAGRPRPPNRPPDNNNNDHHGPDHGDQSHNPPTPPNRPPTTDHRDGPGRDDHTAAQPPAKPASPPAKPAPSDHRTDNRPNPDRTVTPPPPRSLPANNPPPRAPDRPVERPAPPPPKQQDAKPDPKDDDKRQQER